MGDEDSSLVAHGKTAGVRLNGERRQKLSARRKPLHTLIPKLSRVDFVVFADRDPDARAELTVGLTTATPLQEELWERNSIVIGPCRNTGQLRSAGRSARSEELPP